MDGSAVTRRLLWRLGWPAPTRGTTQSAAGPLTSPTTSTSARARVTTSRHVEEKNVPYYTRTCTHVRACTCAHDEVNTHLCDGAGQHGAFRPAGHRVQPGPLLQREHRLVRALRRLSNASIFVCAVHACGLSVALEPLYLTLKRQQQAQYKASRTSPSDQRTDTEVARLRLRGCGDR